MLIAYNLIRGLMAEAAATIKADPRDISFVESLQLIKDVTPHFQAATTDQARAAVRQQLLTDLAETLNPQPRRDRQYARVVKIKMSKFPCKSHTPIAGRHRDYVAELKNTPIARPHLASLVTRLSSALSTLAGPAIIGGALLLAIESAVIRP